ncbi:MAG: hypothetical protein ACXAEX_00530 [Promethearchaeota archaeon]|jgi:hypothetical protein
MVVADVIKILLEIVDQFEEKFYPNLTGAVIPFSDIKELQDVDYIYTGDEKIPFEKRLPEYQKIFIAEFLSN